MDTAMDGRYRASLWGFAVIVPLVLALVGIWQAYRGFTLMGVLVYGFKLVRTMAQASETEDLEPPHAMNVR